MIQPYICSKRHIRQLSDKQIFVKIALLWEDVFCHYKVTTRAYVVCAKEALSFCIYGKAARRPFS